MPYQPSFVAFIDILGFAEMIARSERDEVLLKNIDRALRDAGRSSPLLGPPNYPDGWTYAPHETTNFSDSIVMSAAQDVHGLMTVMETARAFSVVLLMMGMLTRGGIAAGGLSHTRTSVFGPGMVRAYRLETTEAEVARIVLDDVSAALIRDQIRTGSSIGTYFASTVRSGDDGVLFLHVLRELEESAFEAQRDQGSSIGAEVEVRKAVDSQWWGEVRQTIVRLLGETRSTRRSFSKVRWFAQYYDRCIRPADGTILERNEWLKPILSEEWDVRVE